uniref:CSON011550 protein n=1 Tax=Culicoides sonorensis TaxID=179676 RepID=A0A336M4D5_CULSO
MKGFMTLILFIFASILASSIAYDLGEKVPQCAGPIYKNAPVFADPADCTKYFECDFGGYLVQKDCGDGTRFDPENNVCVHKSTDSC